MWTNTFPQASIIGNSYFLDQTVQRLFLPFFYIYLIICIYFFLYLFHLKSTFKTHCWISYEVIKIWYRNVIDKLLHNKNFYWKIMQELCTRIISSRCLLKFGVGKTQQGFFRYPNIFRNFLPKNRPWGQFWCSNSRWFLTYENHITIS